MNSGDKFWITVWSMTFKFLTIVALSFVVYYSHRNWVDLKLQQGGWSAKEVMCVREAPNRESMRWMCVEILKGNVDVDHDGIEEFFGEEPEPGNG